MKMFNPDPKIELINIPGHFPCVVIDDFLLNPESFVEFASASRGLFNRDENGYYPGVEMSMPDEYSRQLGDFFMRHVAPHLGAGNILDLYSRMSMVTLQPDELKPSQRICHRDRLVSDPALSAVASVLYLFRNAEFGGTSFYVPKISLEELAGLQPKWWAMPDVEFSKAIGSEPAYMISSNPYFELVCTVPAAWNRIIFYEGTIFHSGHITVPGQLNSDPLRGRLTINSFFLCNRAGMAKSSNFENYPISKAVAV